MKTEQNPAAWIEFAQRSMGQGPDGDAVREIAGQLYAMPDLFALPEPQRTLAAALAADPLMLDAGVPEGEALAQAAALIGCFAPAEIARNFREQIQPSGEDLAAAGRHASQQHGLGRIGESELVALAKAFPDAAELIDYLFLYLRRAEGADFAALALAVPEHYWQPEQLRHAVRALCASEEPWCAEQLLLDAAAAGLSGPELESLLIEAASRAGEAMYALLRQITASAPQLPEIDALALAERLAQSGAHIDAARILVPHAAASPAAAFAYATALSQGPAETRTSRHWRDVAGVHHTAKIERGLAIAMVDDLEYAEAEALFGSRIDPAGPAIGWRDLAYVRERTGDHQGWAQLISELERSYPGDPWVVSERAKHALETADNSPKGRRIRMLASAQDATLRRVIARRLPIEGKNDEAEAMWRGIAAETGRANDQFQHVLALCQCGSFEDAELRLSTLRARFPADYRFHLKHAQLAERRARHDLALDSFAAALMSDPRNLDSRAGIARCLTYLGETRRADRWLDMNEGGDVRATWQFAARAFNAVRSDRPERAIEAMAALRATIASFQQTLVEHHRADPGAVWIRGEWRRAPGASYADYQARFLEDLEWLGDGSIVLVGNSPRLLETEHGARIDEFDRVVRLNDFREQGFERHVGSRTDLWFSSANRLAKPNVAELEGTRIWLSQPYAPHFPELASFSRARLGLDLSDHRTTYLPPYAHELSAALIYPRPSTGFRMIGFLEAFVGRPYSITGFSFFQDEAMHYFDETPGRLQIGEVHAVAFERDFVEEVLALSPLLSRF